VGLVVSGTPHAINTCFFIHSAKETHNNTLTNKQDLKYTKFHSHTY